MVEQYLSLSVALTPAFSSLTSDSYPLPLILVWSFHLISPKGDGEEKVHVKYSMRVCACKKDPYGRPILNQQCTYPQLGSITAILFFFSLPPPFKLQCLQRAKPNH